MDLATKQVLPDTSSTPGADITDAETALPSDAEEAEMPDAGPMCTCSSCTGKAPSQSGKKQKKKRYAPPQPDANTFTTQQEFLDSIMPISIESVDENSRKCPICWKPFGEAADPGFDNTEQPVRLRCDHVFGDKCLRHTFALPGTSTVDIRPLTLTPKSRGDGLGQKLRKYAESEKGSDLFDAEIFSKMLKESYRPEKGSQIFGDYWWPVVRQLQHGTQDLSGITLLDNAVILDRKPSKSRDRETKGKKLVKTPGGYEVYVPSVAAPATPGDDSSITFPSLYTTVVQPLALPVTSGPPAHPAASMFLDQYYAFTTSLPSMAQTQTSPLFPPMEPSSLPQVGASALDPAQSEPVSQLLETWEQALAEGQTHLDKLIAKKEALEAKIKGSSVDESELKKQQLATQQMALQKASESQKLAEMHRQAQEAQERMKQESLKFLAIELARIYAAYMAELDDYKEEQEPERRLQYQPRFLPTSFSVHRNDLSSTSYNIRSLDQFLPMVFYSGDDEESGADDDDKQQSMLSKITLVITRTFCSSCCQISDKEAADLETPTKLWWKNDRKVPDDCPICYKILFHKGIQPPRRSQLENIETDEESEDGAMA